VGLPRLKRALGLAAQAWVCACAGEDAASIPVGALSQRLRPDAADSGLLQPRYEAGSTVMFHDSSAGHFRVHFVRTGVHAVPPRDANADGTPDYVQDIADEYERVLSFYLAQGFRAPVSDEAVSDGNGGDGRFDVYLLNFPTGADGSYRGELSREPPGRGCAGYMLQENDFDGRGYASLQDATRIIASHELFHALQNAYVNEVSIVLSEASAVWASERYDARSNDFEAFVPGYLARPERSLLQEPTGPPDAFSYGAALWFRQLEEAYDAALVPRLWDELAQGEAADLSWAQALARVVSRDYQSSLHDAFTRFARWNLFTAGRADPGQAYAEGARYPLVAERAVTLPFHDDLVRLLPLSAHHFAAPFAGERVHVAVAPADALGEHRVLLARERAGRIADVREAPAAQVSTLDGLALGDRIHLVLVDARAEGGTLRVRLCLGDESAVSSCAAESADAGAAPGEQDGGTPPAHADASDDAHADDPSRADDARPRARPADDSTSAGDAEAAFLTDAGAASDVRARNGGCSSNQRAPAHGVWLALPLLWLSRRRRAAPQC
jgi:hypothetical protein